MSLTLLEYGLPLDICLIIERINYKEIFKLVFEELIEKIENNTNYEMHEFYFVQILPFIKTLLIIPPPTFNNNYVSKIFYYNVNYKTEHSSHYFLYKDHMNYFIYQKKIYNLYYNPI